MTLINFFFFLLTFFQYSTEKLGWNAKQGKSHLDTMLRGEILIALAMLRHEETPTGASRRFRAFFE